MSRAFGFEGFWLLGERQEPQNLPGSRGHKDWPDEGVRNVCIKVNFGFRVKVQRLCTTSSEFEIVQDI